jgi:hypothetical protein
MCKFSERCTLVFERAICDYHLKDDVNAIAQNTYKEYSIEFLLYRKNWIDTVQWHLEDIIRDPELKPEQALDIKRRIDRSNQERTDMVELIDIYFFRKYSHIPIKPEATINTESPAWAIDRLSILMLKIYHMKQEASRINAEMTHRTVCEEKLNILCEQQTDLSVALDQLLDDIGSGKKLMKIYKQMKMYNDPALNPVLYKKCQKS